MKAYLLGKIASILFKLLGLTFRYKLVFQNPEDQNKINDNHHYIFAFFHQDELCLINFFKNKNFAGMVSWSKDGEIMSNVVRSFGYTPIRGSSSKGAARALLSCIKAVKSGHGLAHAVDGPRGPIYKVKEGVIAIQNKADVKILPVRAYPSHAKIFEKSWNKAKFPKPFSTIELRFGELKKYDSAEKIEQTLTSL